MATPAIRSSLRSGLLAFGALGEGISRGRRIWNATPPDLWLNCPARNEVDPGHFFEVFDDFLCPASATASDYMTWTSMDDGGTGTNAFQTAAAGVYNVVTAAADNDYHAMRSVAKTFKFEAGKELWFEARFKVAEATTNESTWWFGFTDTVTTGGMQSDTGGPLASYDGALIWKTPEAAMTVNFETSNAGTQNTLSAFATSVTDTWHRVGMYFDGAATTANIYPWFHNGTIWTAGASKTVTLASMDEMYMVFGIKAGPTAAAETLQVDYVKAVQLR